MRKESSSQFLQNTTDMSFNPKKTSTQVRGGKKQGGVVKERASAMARRGRRALARDIDSEEDEEEEEGDPELLSLLEPSARVSRLVGLSQLGRHTSSRETRVSSRGSGGSERDTTDDDETSAPAAGGKSREKRVLQTRRKSAIRPISTATKTTATKSTAATTSKKTTKSSRKSVAFNPHTTNLGSPDQPVTVAQRGSSPSSDSGGGVYDYVPSDEEDLSHNKSRLYSPRKKKSILRKSSGSSQRESTRNRGEEGEGSGAGSGGEEMRQEVGGEWKKSGHVREMSIQVKDISSKAKGATTNNASSKVVSTNKDKNPTNAEPVDSQWFVPENLSLHQMISDKSPRSLQRLRRTGRKNPPTADDTTSTVAPPPRRGKDKRRPRELDSTTTADSRVEGGGGNESGSQRGGVSSGDEAGPSSSSSSSSRRQPKTKETTNAQTTTKDVANTPKSASGKTTGRKKSTKSKVTPPWQKVKKNKKRATPQSDEHHTEEEEEEEGEETGTPASKKHRVSTMEEDEGMQSGGGLSLSSSEGEGEPSEDLVRSMGGRRYRRYAVEYQNPKTPGVRRSKRTRVAPIQQWKNEEPVYERRRSGKTTTHTILCYFT